MSAPGSTEAFQVEVIGHAQHNLDYYRSELAKVEKKQSDHIAAGARLCDEAAKLRTVVADYEAALAVMEANGLSLRDAGNERASSSAGGTDR